MTERRPIEAEVRGVGGDQDVPEQVFREVFSHHAAAVTIAAVRADGGNVHATTATSFIPVSVSPPTVLLSLGGNAQVLPFLDEGRRFVVNILAAEQRKLATVYADSFPVGPSPFPEKGEPVVPGSLASLHCRVESLVDTEGGKLVLARVVGMSMGGEGKALVHFRRRYHSVG